MSKDKNILAHFLVVLKLTFTHTIIIGLQQSELASTVSSRVVHSRAKYIETF